MKLAKIVKIAFNMVKANKLRSWLTIIGIIIGIASVMAIITTGEYFQEQVTETLEGLGADTITIVASTPYQVATEEVVEDTGSTSTSSDSSGEIKAENSESIQSSGSEEVSGSDPGTSAESSVSAVSADGASISTDYEPVPQAQLTKMDVFTLLSIPGIEYINVNVEKDAEMKFGSESTSVWIKGIDPKVWPEITKKKLEQGRMLQAGDRAVVIISKELSNGTFEREIRLNQMILLNGKSYRVVGILAKNSGLLAGFGGFFESGIYMPYQEMYTLPSSLGVDIEPQMEKEIYDSIEIKLDKGADYDATLKEIERKLRLSRRVTEETQDFYVNSPKEAIESTRQLINGLTAFLAFIAGISLLVGSTGIANTMFTSVLEKTKEIGIMKAIGAKNRDILLIFLCNAAMISLVGGIIGILLGTAAVQAILLFISIKMNAPFEFALSLKGTIVATLVSIIVGLIAGLVPAKNASELRPVDALRYE